ncbi:MAG: glycosyl hydrolase 53 family protein [Salinivirgaceae bacterium]
MKTNYILILMIVGLWPMYSIAQETLLGVDLSYVNEMEDCNAVYYQNGDAKEVYSIFKDNHAQVVRFRLWHNPTWTQYSNFADVKKGIGRAKASGMKVLLDFHYSDTWTDPSKQERPAAWKDITDINVLADSVYNYTFNVLSNLKKDNLMPEFVQIGNETNGNIMVGTGETLYPLNWTRNVKLFKVGIKAANDVDAVTKTVLHIAGPNNGDWWFTDAKNNGLTNFDIIGLSYYPQWHKQSISQVGSIVKNLKTKFTKPVWIVETGYPWTLDNNGDASNILNQESILAGYSNPPTPKSQKNFLINLNYAVISNGGMGTIYWEPAWVSTSCSTLWGPGSHYENATFFDFNNQLHEGIEYLNYDYSQAPVTSSQVTFSVDMTGVTITDGVFVTGSFTGTNWQFMPMVNQGNNRYNYTTTLQKGDTGAYIYTVKADWDMALYHEKVPVECAPMWGTHRKYVIEGDTETFAFKWSSCEELAVSASEQNNSFGTKIYPNPFDTNFFIETLIPHTKKISIVSIDGKLVSEFEPDVNQIDGSNWNNGIYQIQWMDENNKILKVLKIVKN